jgi:predicted transcriptional regulator
MTKKDVEKRILQYIKASPRPVSTRELSETLKIAWHTADRYCLKLQLKKKVDCFTIGKATAWFATTKRK